MEITKVQAVLNSWKCKGYKLYTNLDNTVVYSIKFNSFELEVVKGQFIMKTVFSGQVVDAGFISELNLVNTVKDVLNTQE